MSLHRPRHAPRAALFAALLLGGCGGGGGGGGGDAPPVPSAALSTLIADRSEAPADGTTPVLLVATVRDAGGAPLAGTQLVLEVNGSAVQVQDLTPTTDAGGTATTLVTADVPGSVTIGCVVDPGSQAVRLQQTATITFVPLVPPQVAGPARCFDVDRSGTATAGDRVVVPFTTPIVFDGASLADVALPVLGDTFGAGAQLAVGPAADELTITLGDLPRLRTRGVFAPGATTANAPSGLLLLAGDRLRNAVDGAPFAGTAAIDLAPAPVALPGPLPSAARLVGAGRLSLDGIGDVLAVYGDTLQPWFGGGSGGFTAGPILGLTEIRAVVVHDLNGVPVDEALTAHAFGVQVWNNQPLVPGGSELVAGGIVAAGDTWSVLAADVDGDGWPDVGAGTASGVVVARHQRDANNTFVIEQALPIGGPVAALASGDLDGDGDRDLLAALPGSDAVAVLWNDGDALVVGPMLALLGAHTVTAGDVDGDGRADVVAAGALTTCAFRNMPNGFVETDLGAPAAETMLVDVDRDAVADLLLRFDDRVELRLADRAGGFAPAIAFGGAAPRALAVRDLDGDADLDFVVTGDGGTTVWAGSSAGTFGATAYVPGAALGATASAAEAIGDLDGDGAPDLVVATTGGLAAWFGDGAGGFAAGPVFGPADATALALADLDGDLDLDLVVARDGEDHVWANDGAGGFAFAQAFAPGTATRALAVGDTDGDGDPDIVLGNDGDNRIFRNESGGGVLQFAQDPSGFVLLPFEQIERDTIALAMWDCDRDGDLDLLVLNRGTPDAPQDALLLVNTDLGYVVRQTLASAQLATGLALGDVDGDGRLDVVIGRGSADGAAAVQVHRGTSDRLVKLPLAIAAPGPRAPTGIAVCDVDADGRSDLALADGRSPRPVLVLRQQVDGTFAPLQQLDGLTAARLHAVDLDRDGDVDLVAGRDDGPVRVLPNR